MSFFFLATLHSKTQNPRTAEQNLTKRAVKITYILAEDPIKREAKQYQLKKKKKKKTKTK